MEKSRDLAAMIILIMFTGSQAITRSTVIARAETWVGPPKGPVPYSQSLYLDGYRTDCSGYVSMAWNTGTSYNTNSLLGITTSISKNDLKAGDILLKPGSHVTIFGSWADSQKTRYKGFEQVGGSQQKTKTWNIVYPYWGGASGYQPRRYVNIQD